MARFVRYLNEANEIKWGLVNTQFNFLEIEGDRFTQWSVTDRSIDSNKVKILPPCEPTKIVAVGLNYKDHAAEMKLQIPDEPLLFLKATSAVIGCNDKIILPEQSRRVDYEAELAVIIKNEIFDIDEDEVDGNILGYTCFNDVTARDLQNKDGQWARAKSFNTFAPVGPYVTKKIDPDNVNIRLYLNGELKQSGNTQNFIFRTRFLISYISKIMTLKRGDIVTTGTPAGIGQLRKGDHVEVEVEGLGRLINTVE